MKPIKKITIIIWQSMVSSIPLFYLLVIWKHLPESVPIHFNGQFEADGFGTKLQMSYTLFLLTALSIGSAMLLNNLDKFDPKQRIKSSGILLTKISWAMVSFISLISIFLVFQTSHYTQPYESDLSKKFFFIIVALLFVVMGNLMNNIKPNYFVGIRTPWALENEENWRMTHYFCSRIWFFGGLLITILIVLLPASFAFFIIIFGSIPLIVTPVLYSYNLFRQKQKKA